MSRVLLIIQGGSMFRLMIVLISSAFLFACSSTSGEKTAYSNEDMVCEYVAKTGSNLKRRTCMTRELSEELRKESEHDLREAWSRGQTQAHTK